MAGLDVAGNTVQFNDALKIIGVTLAKLVTNVVRACTFHTRPLRHIRPPLTLEAAKVLRCPLCGADSTIATAFSMARRSRTLIVFSGCRTSWHAWSSDLRGQPVHLVPRTGIALTKTACSIQVAMAAFTFKAKHSGLPAYLCDDLHDYQPLFHSDCTPALPQ